MGIFFKPTDGWAADFIPFFWQGEYHLFYLKDYRDKSGYGEGTPWFHLGTRDFVTFTDYGEALPRGTPEDQDLYVFTGCVIEKDGLFHIFYTGHNPHFPAQGKPQQAVMHAISRDLITWEKDPANPILFADPQYYEMHDWRDPFVFWNTDTDEYWMLLAARLQQGPDNRRGVIALGVSQDLGQWEIRQPFWQPNLYYTHECPDLFRIGDWWYLVYSTFSERHVTHYRMSRYPSGPWRAPRVDSFDGRAFYAAKTASDGKRTFAFGWNPTRTQEKDTGSWNWGGHLVIHEIRQTPDGSLSVTVPNEIIGQFSKPVPVQTDPQPSGWINGGDSMTALAEGKFTWCRLALMPRISCLETSIRFSEDTHNCGVVLRADDSLNRYYQIRLEPALDRVVFERWPRPGDEPPIMERFVPLPADTSISIKVLVQDSVIVVYVGDTIAMNVRGYEHTDGCYGLFAAEGKVTFTQTTISELVAVQFSEASYRGAQSAFEDVAKGI